MKNKNNKTVIILNYFTSICFYIVSIMKFIKGSNSTGFVFLCLDSVHLNKDNK